VREAVLDEYFVLRDELGDACYVYQRVEKVVDLLIVCQNK
jgi:hypothetical protein